MLDVSTAPESQSRIIRTAERLFAEHGFNGVSLRQISKAAGHRNVSAIQYHFGGRDELIKAVFLNRMSSINPRRLAILARLESESRLTDVRALIGAWVWPLAEELNNERGECFYLRFIERFLRDRSLLANTPNRTWLTGWNKTNERLAGALRDLPKAMVKTRLELAANQCISGLAAIEALGSRSPNRPLMVEVLIDALVAGLLGAPSKESLEKLRQ